MCDVNTVEHHKIFYCKSHQLEKVITICVFRSFCSWSCCCQLIDWDILALALVIHCKETKYQLPAFGTGSQYLLSSCCKSLS